MIDQTMRAQGPRFTQTLKAFAGAGMLAFPLGVFGTAAKASPEESTKACIEKLRLHANLTVEAAAAKTDAGWFTDTVTWMSPDVECRAKSSGVDYLRVGGQIFVIDGFSGAEARAAYEQMGTDVDATARAHAEEFRHLEEKVESEYADLLRRPNPDVDAVLERLKQELSMASREFHVDFYEKNAKRIQQLDAIEVAAGKAETDVTKDPQTFALANRVVELELQLDENKSEKERLASELASEREMRVQQVSEMQSRLAAAEAERDQLKQELLSLSLPKHISELENLVSEHQFTEAEAKLQWLRTHKLLDEKSLTEVEASALKTIRSIPASSRELNLAGYQFLVALRPDSDTYGKKRDQYSGIAAGTYWVNDPTARHPDLYSCPSFNCGKVGERYHGDKVTVKEARGNFARITDYSPAFCSRGLGGDFDSGRTDCTEANGILDGKIARWIDEAYLSPSKPEVSRASTEAEEWVAGSDDYQTYRYQFASAAEKLVSDRKCTKQDFQSGGGWTASPGNGNYFIWCRNDTVKYYLNVKTGHITK